MLNVQPAQCIIGEGLEAYVTTSAAKVKHLVHSMGKLQESRDASERQAVHLNTHIAQLEANLASAKQQAAEAQGDMQSASEQFEVLSQQCNAWEQDLEAILTVLHRAKRKRQR